MELSTSFLVDIRAEWVKSHNAEAVEVIDAFQRDKPIRVPLFGDDAAYAHGFYADEINLDHNRYYTDPDEMLGIAT